MNDFNVIINDNISWLIFLNFRMDNISSEYCNYLHFSQELNYHWNYGHTLYFLLEICIVDFSVFLETTL